MSLRRAHAILIGLGIVGYALCYGEPQALFTYPTAAQNSGQRDVVTYSYEIPIRYTAPKTILAALTPLYPAVQFSSHDESRELLFKSTAREAKEIRRTVQKLDRELPQIKLEIQVIEAGEQVLEKIKPLLAGLSGEIRMNYTPETGILKPMDTLQSELQFLTSTGKARILSRPSLLTQENRPATIKVGDRIPYLTVQTQNTTQIQSIQYIDTGIELELTPITTENQKIAIEIQAKVSTVKVWKVVGNQIESPILSTRETTTKVLIPNKTTLVIAGLIDETLKETIGQVPLLSQLPFLGEAFKSRQTETIRSDIIFLITPTIIEGAPSPPK